VPVLSPVEAAANDAFGSSYPGPHPTIIGSRGPINITTDFERLNLQPGLHTKEILCELGLTEYEIRHLALGGTFGDALSAVQSAAKL